MSTKQLTILFGMAAIVIWVCIAALIIVGIGFVSNASPPTPQPPTAIPTATPIPTATRIPTPRIIATPTSVLGKGDEYGAYDVCTQFFSKMLVSDYDWPSFGDTHVWQVDKPTDTWQVDGSYSITLAGKPIEFTFSCRVQYFGNGVWSRVFLNAY